MSIGGLVLARATRGSTTRNTEEMRHMETDKPRIGTVARLAGKVAHLELVPAEAPVPEHDPAVGLALVRVDRVLAAATDQVAVEHKISGPLVGRVGEPVQEISVAAIALAVGQVPAAPVAELARCRLTDRRELPAEMVSEIVVSHPAQDSVRVATLLVAVDLGAPPLDLPVLVEVPAWEAVDSAMVVLVVAGAAGADAVAAAGGVDEISSVRNTNEIESKYYDFVEIVRDRMRDR
jgi:hypothetical protein